MSQSLMFLGFPGGTTGSTPIRNGMALVASFVQSLRNLASPDQVEVIGGLRGKDGYSGGGLP